MFLFCIYNRGRRHHSQDFFFFFARVTPERASHMTCDIHMQNSTVKAHIIGRKFLSLSLFQTHPSTAVLSGANQRNCGLGSSEGLFSYCLMCNPGCNKVNTGAKIWVQMLLVVTNSFWFWGFLPPCLGERRTIRAFSWKMAAFLLRWSSDVCLELRDIPLPRKPKQQQRKIRINVNQ